jgi:hypothetical protein
MILTHIQHLCMFGSASFCLQAVLSGPDSFADDEAV